MPATSAVTTARRLVLVPAERKSTDAALKRFRLARVQLEGRERVAKSQPSLSRA